MKSTKITLLVAVLSIITTTAIVAAASNAFEGNSNPEQMKPKFNAENSFHQGMMRKNFDPQRHEHMQQIFENKDYEAWKELVSGKPIAEKINSQQAFEKFIQMKEFLKNKDIEQADKLRQELGIELSQKMKKHAGQNIMNKWNKGEMIDENHDGICDKLDIKEEN